MHFPKEIVYSFLQFLERVHDINGYDTYIQRLNVIALRTYPLCLLTDFIV